MFTTNEYLNHTPYKNEAYSVKVRDDEFMIRRMNGLESLQLEDLETSEERAKFVLTNCLYDGANCKPIGSVHAENFIRQYGGLAVDVVKAIISETATYERNNRKQLETEIKNSDQNGSKSSSGNTAKDSGSTQNNVNPEKKAS